MNPRLVFLDLRGPAIRPMDPPATSTVLCLGNLDGVHVAHTSLLQRARELSRTVSQCTDSPCLCGIFSFFRPTGDYFPSPVSAPKANHLTTLREKLYQCKAQGMDIACLCEFGDVRGMAADAFLSLLRDRALCRGVVCGFNFHFGVDGTEDAAYLMTHFHRPADGYFAHVEPPVSTEGETISSTRIRRLLREGDTESATRLLGRPYALEATVVKGKRLGRALGFPTANQRFPAERLVPATGVYAVCVHTPTGVFPGVANVGSHPTVDVNAAVNCETHVIGAPEGMDLYGQRIRVEFMKHLRPEATFSDVGALAEAIRRDVAAATDYLNGIK